MRGLWAVLLGATMMHAAAQVRVLYVAPEGNDAWSGRRAAPNRARTDGPVQTVQRALQLVLEGAPAPTEIRLRGGVYYLREPILITPEHTERAQRQLTFTAYANEQPILSGGRIVSGWKQGAWQGKTVWIADLPEVHEGKWYFRQLFVNGARAVRARYPNRGYLPVEALLEGTPDWFQGHTRFRYRAGDLPSFSRIEEGEALVFNRWVESRLPLQAIDPAERVLSFRKRSTFALQEGDLYYLENLPEALDEAGEWYLSRAEGKLYYLPRSGERVDTTLAIAPVQAQLVRLIGKPEAGVYVEGVRFVGITFRHTEWSLPAEMETGGFVQAAFGVPGAIYAEGARHCEFIDCTIEQVGTYAIELGRGCQYNRIEGCTLRDLGAGGIKIGEPALRDDTREQTFGNLVQDCVICDGGKLFASAVGIWIGQSYSNRLIHNTLYDFYYTGISIGWTWGYGKSLAGGNRVEFNHVHHIGVRSNGDGPILSDMGGIYTLGMQRGTVIRNNLWHDIAGYRYGGWGIYFDEGSSGILAENNLVYRTTHGGFHQHYGRENIVRNNIFAYAREHQIQASRPEEHLRFIFERNIVLGRGAQWLAGGIDGNMRFDYNLYWREDGSELRFGSDDFAAWQAKGQDKHSRMADPLFENPAAGDFRLKPNSPALALGFEPFDLSQVGARNIRSR
ncbi:MAG: right-handed parallel beta-helix repeat-containing protein [Fimbriimonadales bacterium]|nr:right-handed parallel beta-helix repeat-containing protein [Fimbriimonadales bacterium]